MAWKTLFPNGGANDRAIMNRFYEFAAGRPVGNVIYVSSDTGSSSGPGWSPHNAYATIDQAVNAATAGNHDFVVVLPGHTETIAAAGIDADVAGLTIVGLGQGSEKPTVTLNATTSDVDVDADNVTIRGLRFVSDVDSLVTFIDCNSSHFTLEDCDFVTSGTKEALCFVDLATTKDYLTVRGCKFIQPTDPEGVDGNAGTGVFYFVDSEYLFFEDCFFDVAAETSIWHNKTTAAKNVWIRRCYGQQTLSGAEVFTQVAAMTGGIHDSLLIVTGAADVTEANVTGTLSAGFFVSTTASFGNDGGGGQGALKIAGDAS